MATGLHRNLKHHKPRQKRLVVLLPWRFMFCREDAAGMGSGSASSSDFVEKCRFVSVSASINAISWSHHAIFRGGSRSINR